MAEDNRTSSWIIETTDATFEQDVIVRSKELPVIVDFWAEWCQPCRLLAPMLENLAIKYDGKFLLAKANTEHNPTASAMLGVQSIPAVYGFRHGELFDFFIGLLAEDQVVLWLERLLPTPAEQLVVEARRAAANDPAAAEQGYREAIRLDNSLATAKIELGQLLADQGRVEEAQMLLDDLERRGFLEPEAEKLKAVIDVRGLGAEAGSVDDCRAAVAGQPENHELKLKLAEALAAAGQYEEALETTLGLVRDHKAELGEQAKKVMLDIFRLLPDDSELTSSYRRKLATALY